MTDCGNTGDLQQKGTYALVMHLKRHTAIPIGSLGIVHFQAGYFVYAGSAQGGLEARLRYHLRATKRFHWHIDYLLAHASLQSVWYQLGDNQECFLAGSLADNFIQLPRFGSSDCRCTSHLFYSATTAGIQRFFQARQWKEIKVQPAP